MVVGIRFRVIMPIAVAAVAVAIAVVLLMFIIFVVVVSEVLSPLIPKPYTQTL